MRLPALPSADSVDLSDIEFWNRPALEREAAFAALRAHKPVSFHKEFEPPPGMPLPRGPGYWAITKHADILEVSRTPEVFCSGKGTNIPDLPEQFNEFFGSMLNMDEPRHGRLRRIVSRGFTPRALGRLEAMVEKRAQQTLDRVIDLGACDFVTDIAAPLPLELVCDLMGIPDSETKAVFAHSNIILGLGDPEYVAPGTSPIVAALTSGKALADLMNELAQRKAGKGGDDFTSALLDAEIDGETLTGPELASFFVLLVVAGNETTRNAISHGMRALCDYPDQRRKWAADFDALEATALEEIVRWASPVIHFRRTATRDTQLSGQTIRAGDKVVMWYGSGNRDEDVFDRPYQFDLARDPNEHVGFGGPGPHHCLGANLARREMRVMFRELFRRMPDLEITGAPEMLRSNFIHGIKHMPCAWGKRAH
ncbi:MAG: cytochrome P450 [Myxococcota bacterium]